MRYFGLVDSPISVDQIAGWLQTALIDGELESEEEEEPGSWNSLILYLDGGEAVVEIEKFSNADDTLADQIQDTVRDLLDDKTPVLPHSSVKWLCQYMSRVKVLYEFRPMAAINTEAGWEIFNEVWTNLRENIPGIAHLDDEGFTNLAGAQITLEYPEKVSDQDKADQAGELKVAVLDESGERWIEYTINLADEEQKQMFLSGKAPEGGV